MLTSAEVKAYASTLESASVERTLSEKDTDKFREAICAFANDLPDARQPGFLFIGISDAGEIVGARVDDRLLQYLTGLRSDGEIQPFPVLNAYLAEVDGKQVAVVEVQPSDSPPVRARGRVWVRVGPRRSVATAEEERRLSEKRVHGVRTFDGRSCPDAVLDDLLIDDFRAQYLPSVVAAEVLAQNRRSLEDQLASVRFWDPRKGHPTFAGLLVVGLNPRQFMAGAYVQFARYAGTGLDAPVRDQKELGGNLLTLLRKLDELLPLQLRTASEPGAGLQHVETADYPLIALRELVINAILHRSYEGTNAPVRLYWFDDHVEIQNPGGLFGHVTKDNFERTNDYRNPVLAEALKALGYVERFGTGIHRAQAALERNGNPPAVFHFEPTHVLVTLRGRP